MASLGCIYDLCRRLDVSVKRWPEDIAFSNAMRESYDYTCCDCKINLRHDPGRVDCAHLQTRSNRNTRWCTEWGAIVLCRKCHMYFTTHPLDWADFCRQYLGSVRYEEAVFRSHQIRKFTTSDRRDIAEHYRSELDRLGDLRKDGKTGFIWLVNYEGK